jgi:hypothetical protein
MAFNSEKWVRDAANEMGKPIAHCGPKVVKELSKDTTYGFLQLSITDRPHLLVRISIQ